MQAAGFSLILQEEIGIILSISQKNRSLPMTCSRHCSNRACGCNAGFCNLGENLRLYFSSAAWGQQGWGQDLQLFTYQAPAGVIRCFFLSNSEFLCQEVTRCGTSLWTELWDKLESPPSTPTAVHPLPASAQALYTQTCSCTSASQKPRTTRSGWQGQDGGSSISRSSQDIL